VNLLPGCIGSMVGSASLIEIGLLRGLPLKMATTFKDGLINRFLPHPRFDHVTPSPASSMVVGILVATHSMPFLEMVVVTYSGMALIPLRDCRLSTVGQIVSRAWAMLLQPCLCHHMAMATSSTPSCEGMSPDAAVAMLVSSRSSSLVRCR
jgi:hypothetical protein